MNAISSLIAAMSVAVSPAPADCLKDCRASNLGLALIRNFEGYSPTIYKDSAGYPTIGIGHLILPGEEFPPLLLPEDADALLHKDLVPAEKALSRRVKIRIKQNQADALISFTFNLGEGSLAKSTLLKLVNLAQHARAVLEFSKWNKAGGKVLRGLTIRREAEAKLYAS